MKTIIIIMEYGIGWHRTMGNEFEEIMPTTPPLLRSTKWWKQKGSKEEARIQPPRTPSFWKLWHWHFWYCWHHSSPVGVNLLELRSFYLEMAAECCGVMWLVGANWICFPVSPLLLRWRGPKSIAKLDGVPWPPDASSSWIRHWMNMC